MALANISGILGAINAAQMQLVKATEAALAAHDADEGTAPHAEALEQTIEHLGQAVRYAGQASTNAAENIA